MSKNRLVIEMAIFTAFLFVAFGFIIINEKEKDFLLPKIDEKFNQYIASHYQNIKNDIKIGKTKYNSKKDSFEIRVSNKKNKNLYFSLIYKNKKITSTYQQDYIEGDTLLSYLEKKLATDIKSSKYPYIEIKFINKLNKFNNTIQEALITGDNIESLNIYNLYTDLKVSKFSPSKIKNSIVNLNEFVSNNNFNPKYYYLTIINSSNITEEIKLKKLNKNLILTSLDEIINGIISNDDSIKLKFGIDFNYNY